MIRTFSSPARMAPMLGSAFCGPPLTPILFGMRRSDSNSRAIGTVVSAALVIIAKGIGVDKTTETESAAA